MISLGYAHGGAEEVLTLIKQFFIWANPVMKLREQIIP